MKKQMKKIGALVLTMAMAMAMGTTAFAADDVYTGSNNANATSVAGKTSIPLTKGIVFFNANGSTVYEPNISFNYTVAPDANVAADGTTATVTDAESITRNVYPGPAGGVTGTSIAFSSARAVSTSASGTEVEESSNLGVDIGKFERPGIYRYVITEEPSVEVTDAGLTARDDDYDETRYLDVYIHYSTEGGLEMYGAVIFKSETSDSGSEGASGQDSITVATEKTTGFEPGTPGGSGSDGSSSYADDPTVDKYTTYDFTVKKTVSGSMADKNHEFPFYVTVSNTISGAKFTYTADGSETYTGMTVTEGAAALTDANFAIGSDSKESALKLKNNDIITLVGVPSNQTTELAVVIKEFNDTYDAYIPTASATKGTLTMTAKTAMAAQTGSDATESFAVKTNDAAAQILAIDNNLSEISPTGVVLRFAPYALMLGAGIVLFIISRRRRNTAEEA